MVLVVFFLGVLALVCGGVIRSRIRRRRSSQDLSDDEVQTILASGTLQRDDEPLDLDQAEDAEEQFWASESWDEAEEL